MKKYQVLVTPEGQTGIRESFLFIHERSPERCAYSREREYLEEDLRQLIFMSHRIVFQVNKTKNTVYVLHVRHAKRCAGGRGGIVHSCDVTAKGRFTSRFWLGLQPSAHSVQSFYRQGLPSQSEQLS